MLAPVYNPTAHGRTIYVDAANGSDTTGRANSQDFPFATLAAAKAVAVTGDNIKVRPGSYTTTASLAKDGVDWDFDIGASVTRNNNTASGIWDDGNTAMTFRVTGSGTFNRVITSPVGNHGGVVWVRHASSNVFIQAFDLTMDSGPASTPAIDQRDGRLVIRCRNLTAIGDPLTTNVAAFWANGFFDVEGSLCNGQVWWEVVSAPTGDMHMRFTEFHPLASDTFYDSSSRSDAAVWIHGNTMRPGANKFLLTKQGVSRLYLTAQKFFGAITVNVPTTLETENFTANGNFTPDPDVTTALFNVKAGAGGGGGSNDTLGGGGGGGGGQQTAALNLTPGSPVAIVVGAGGAGGAADTDGLSGDPSSATFGTAISATGGSGGQSGTNGGAGGAGGVPDGTSTGGNGDGANGGAGGSNGLNAVGGNGGNPTPGGEAGLDGEDGSVLVSWEDPTLSRGKLYLIADKIDGRVQINNRHKVIIEIKDWEAVDSSPFITVGTAGISSAVVDVYGGYLEGDVDAVSLAGGELRLHNVTLDTTASASVNPVDISGGTLTLIDCTLLAESTRDSITAGSAQTVLVRGTLSKNRPVHSNVSQSTDVPLSQPIIKVETTAPANDVLLNGTVAFYTDGNGDLKIKLKDPGGTVRTGTVDLA